MKILNLIFCLFFALILGCKKSETKTDEQVPTETPKTATKYDAFIVGSTYVSSWAGTIPTIGYVYNVFANFMSVPTETMNLLSSVYRGNLFVDSVRLSFGGLAYMDTTGGINLSGQKTFELKSNGVFPSFKYSYNEAFPNFTSNYYQLINTSVSKNKDYVIPLTGLNDADEIKCVLLGGSFLTKIVPKGTSQVVYKVSELSVLKIGEIVTINVELRKFNRPTINGKTIQFESNTNASFSATVSP
jgi:hypothetical protein